jgi:hypothetical protein
MNEVYFVREKKEKSYTVLDNTFIRDETLSWKAKGIMTYILSLPEDWKIYMSEIESHAADGRDSLLSGIKELKEHGYIKMTKERLSDGTFTNCKYIIKEKPEMDKPKSDNPQTEKPITDNPKSDKPKSENPQLLNTNINKVLNIQSTNNIGDSSNRAAEKKTKQKKELKQPLREREPENDYEKVEKAYSEEWGTLYGEGKLSEKEPAPSTWTPCRKLMKELFKTYSADQLIQVVEKAVLDAWIVKGGFNLKTILSGSVLNKLLNSDASLPAYLQPCKHDAFDDMEPAEKTAYLKAKREADAKALEETCEKLPF